MDTPNLPLITSAVAPVVMVSAAGLLFMGMQTKNLHLADRVRALMVEYRGLGSSAAETERRDRIVQQLRLFEVRVRLSQRALELLYAAIVCFVLTSLLLAAGAWSTSEVLTVASAGIFVVGVGLLLTALIMEFREMRVGLKTIGIEMEPALRAPAERGGEP
ncbi:MAG TPA: DUF2721 domain-containing protein [Methylomirabilota bacterium]|jgi:hypothetical protein|nr:DUF2721 domain-containing protein [Methylomirabilota bacterium]